MVVHSVGASNKICPLIFKNLKMMYVCIYMKNGQLVQTAVVYLKVLNGERYI